MKKCPFWSSDMSDKECFTECIMKESMNDEECIFLEYLDDVSLEKVPSIEVLNEVASDRE